MTVCEHLRAELKEAATVAWQEVINALQKESANLKSIPFVRVAHPLILLRFLGSYAIWTAALRYIGLVLLSTFLGLVLGLMLATPPTVFCIYKRLKVRAKKREERVECT